jgi:hypothetical protein
MSAQFARIESILARLANRAAALGFDSLTPQERTALLAYSAHGLVARGGLRLFYEGPLPLAELVLAFRELKLNGLANAAFATASLFPDPALADDPVMRREHLAALNTDKQDYVFFRLSSDELLRAISSFWQRAGQPTNA